MTNIDQGWKRELQQSFSSDYMKKLNLFLESEVNAGKIIYPDSGDMFNAFNYTPYDKVKVVIIGQDPYHGPNQAHGLCFSVQKGVKIPPSLKNIYKELVNDIGFEIPEHGYLEEWARQGVLMLNAVLSVEESMAGSHRKKGWEQFTDEVIKTLNDKKENLVFILWGNDAKKKGANIDRAKHLVLESAHPSPFSVTKFLGNKHFSKTNEYLRKHNIEPIDWQIH
jgi:uracil-DNA glycosylase